MKVSDSQWHKQLSELGGRALARRARTGSARSRTTRRSARTSSARYDRVGEELARYIQMGYTTFILDIPPSEEELEHTAIVFERATAQVA